LRARLCVPLEPALDGLDDVARGLTAMMSGSEDPVSRVWEVSEVLVCGKRIKHTEVEQLIIAVVILSLVGDDVRMRC
jgi:hypothetical protein